MSTREMILETIRRNQPAAAPLPDVPLFEGVHQATWSQFKQSVERMGGKGTEAAADADLTALVKGLHPDAAVICSATPEVAGNRQLRDVGEARELDDVDVGVVRAVFGVAETGSVYLSDQDLGVRALGYLSQHFVVLLDPAEIVGNLHEAYVRPEFADASYAVLMTGPSATADIEGVLIHGAQGVRTLNVVAAPRP